MRIKNNILKKIVLKLAHALDLTDELTPEEKLEGLITEMKPTTLLQRIEAIRNSGYFIPDYDKPRLYSDIKILYNDSPIKAEDGFKPISDKTILIERPEDFGNNIRAWKKAVRIQNKKENKRKRELAEQEERVRNSVRGDFADMIMNQMMKLN